MTAPWSAAIWPPTRRADSCRQRSTTGVARCRAALPVRSVPVGKRAVAVQRDLPGGLVVAEPWCPSGLSVAILMSASNRRPMTSRRCLTSTVISTVLPLPLAPTSPIIGLLESTKSMGKRGVALRAGPPLGRATAGRAVGRTHYGRALGMKVGKVSCALPGQPLPDLVLFFLALDVARGRRTDRPGATSRSCGSRTGRP